MHPTPGVLNGVLTKSPGDSDAPLPPLQDLASSHRPCPSSWGSGGGAVGSHLGELQVLPRLLLLPQGAASLHLPESVGGEQPWVGGGLSQAR